MRRATKKTTPTFLIRAHASGNCIAKFTHPVFTKKKKKKKKQKKKNYRLMPRTNDNELNEEEEEEEEEEKIYWVPAKKGQMYST